MNWKRLAGFSLLLNAVVFAWLLASGQKPGAGRDSRVSESEGRAPGSQLASPIPRSAVRKFDWSQIESTNYLEYIANLRSIGCPEQTIRDIVSADVAGTLRGIVPADAAVPITRTWREDSEQLVNDLMGGSGVREHTLSSREMAVAPSIDNRDRGGLPGPLVAGGARNGTALFASASDPAPDTARESTVNADVAADRYVLSPEIARQRWIATYLSTRYGQQMWNDLQSDSAALGGNIDALLELHKISVPEPPERHLPVTR